MGLAVTLFFALGVASSVTHPGEAPGLRESAWTAAREEVRRADRMVQGRLELSPEASPSRGRISFAQPYDAEEWLSLVSRGLELRDSDAVRAARWVASMPVRLQLDPSRVVVQVELTN